MFYLSFFCVLRGKLQLFLWNEVILKGHDFYNTYHTLSSRIEKWLKYGSDNSLNRIELFTLCDLIQTRIDYKYITYRRVRNKLEEDNSFSTKSLFYNENYYNTSMNLIAFVIEMIDIYIK